MLRGKWIVLVAMAGTLTAGRTAAAQTQADEAALARTVAAALDAVVMETAVVPAAEAMVTAPGFTAAQAYPQDPADSLYRAARAQLDRNEYRKAAESFARLLQRYPRSSYAAQALYYQAFAYYRSGREADLRAAQEALTRLQESYATSEAALRDAEALLARVNGELARRYADVAAAEAIAAAVGRAMPAVAAVPEQLAVPVMPPLPPLAPPPVSPGGQACQGEEEVRLVALQALAQMSPERALPALQRILADRDDTGDCALELRRMAVFVLAQHVSEDNVDLLLDVARNDPSPELRQQAVMWLSAVPGERTLSALQDILRTSSDPEIQSRAILALAQFSDPRATATLRDYALRRDVPAEQRAQAVFWLGQRGPENEAVLREIYASTTELEIKERVLFSLAQAGGEANTTWLMRVARDTEEPMELRKKALHWAASQGIATAELASLYEQLPEDELREQLIYVLAERNEPAAVDRLLEIARSEENMELRKRAIFWLSQSNDPRVAELLLEIIGGG